MSLEITISKDLQDLPRRIAAGLAQGNASAGAALLSECRQELKRVGAYATGKLHASGTVIAGAEVVTVRFSTPASLIEDGRPPGPVPRWSVFRPLLEKWAAAKGLYFKSLWPVAQKIKKVGFPGRWPFRKAIEVSESAINRRLARAMRRAL